ncbi:MAG TPA: lysine-sensitive aspartokinase 3 [Terriglobales bacterium]|nr:lysine-sensitive aspartokinase 3 [Terriglobales bacterium]
MIVMKFGGTSVEDAVAIDRAASIVRSRLEQRPVVVVSAMARITDQLLAMSQAAGKGDVKTALELSRGIRDRHHATASELLGSGGSAQLRAEFDADFNALDDLLRGIAAVGELTPRTMDNVAGYGERMSSKLVAAAFRSRGLNAEMVDSRQCIVTNNSFSKAVPLFDETNERLVKRLAPMLNDSNPRVPVMGGFIGSTVDGIPTTIGRGGSDFSAAIIGAALDAGAIEIWTDVDGMKTTDPKICPDALRIKSIGFDEAAELAYFGAKVLHPSTVLPAVQKDIPVLVLNSRNPENQGTRITARPPSCRNLFKAIAAKKRITILDITATRMLGSHGYLRSIFEVFDRHRCPVDVVTTSEVSISITIDSNDAIPALVADLEKICDVKLSGRNAIVCLVGENIREIKGVAAQVFNAVAAADVNVRMISQGASEINITFVVTEDDVPKAVRALHDAFFKDPDWEVFARE